MIELGSEVFDLLDANLLESAREFSRWNPASECVERAGLVLIAGSTAFPVGYSNCLIREDRGVPAKLALETARSFFGDRGRAFTVFVRNSIDADMVSDLEAQGLKAVSDVPCMIIRQSLEEGGVADGIELRRVRSEEEAHHMVEISCQAYTTLGFPPDEARTLLSRSERLLDPRFQSVVAYRGDEPLSTATVLRSGGAAGVYWVGTVEAGRRQGLAEACTRQVTNAAFEAGERLVTLQASAMGEPIYERLGYRSYDRMRWYLHPAPGNRS